MAELVSINPATGEELGRVPVATADGVRAKVASLRERAAEWQGVSSVQRAAHVHQAAKVIRERSKALAELMTREQGKPIRESTGEVENAADRLDYFCETGLRALAPIEETLPSGIRMKTRFQPIGVVAAIKPWNFPIGIPLWTIGPALLAGNTLLFKPSERTPLLGEAIVDVFRAGGLPGGVLEIVHGADDAGRAVVASDVDMIAFVGSQAAGREIMRGSADRLRRVVLELGGKDPMIVCADADLEKAVDGAIVGTFRNCGQVCCGVERIYVEKSVCGEFLAAVVERTQRLRVGDGLRPDTDVGPMNREEEVQRVERHIADAVSKGARVLAGGRRIRGQFFEPTVITGVRDDMLIAREETFGPVMPVVAVESIEEAIDLANSTDFGLTATVWTRDLGKAQRIALEVQAGTIGINQPVGSLVQAPWGGVKKSGIGRMLGPEAVREFTQVVNYRFPPA